MSENIGNYLSLIFYLINFEFSFQKMKNCIIIIIVIIQSILSLGLVKKDESFMTSYKTLQNGLKVKFGLLPFKEEKKAELILYSRL